MEEVLKQQLAGLGLSPEQAGKLEAEGVLTGADVATLDATEIKEITGCGLVTAKKVVDAFAPVKETVETSIIKAGEAAVVEALPALPEGDKSFIDMLKVPGILKVEAIDVLGAVRASIASTFGVEKVPDILLDRMERFAVEQGEPAPETFYKIQKLITSRNYSDLLSVLGIAGRFMNDKRKKDFLSKVNADFWRALAEFQAQLETWWDLWTGGLQNAGVALLAFKDDKAGVGDDLYSDLTATPDSGALRAAAEAIINRINKIFAGVGIPVERALAYDITKIRELLDERGLPEAVGCTTKEQMLKMIGQELGVSVEADYVDIEKNVALFILGIMKFSEIGEAGSARERKYIIGMRRLGKMIAWEKLGASEPRRAGGPTSGSGSFRSRG